MIIALSSLRLTVAFAQSIEAMCEVENEDVDWGAPKGDAPTTSVWLTRILSTTMCRILEVCRYIFTR